MLLGSTLTTQPYDSGADFRSTGNALPELRATLRQEAARDIRISLRRDICREQTAKMRMVKGEQLNRLLAGYFDQEKQTLEMQLRMALLRMDMRGLLLRVNMAVRFIATMTKMWIFNSNVWSAFNIWHSVRMRPGWQPPVVKFHDFLNALASAEMCKQPGSDDVVVEMVRALSWSTLLWLYLLFLVRLGGWEIERPDAWREVVLTAIPKKSDKVGFRSMR